MSLPNVKKVKILLGGLYMKKSFLTILLVVALVLSTGAQSPPQKQSQEDMEKNLVLVDKPQAVPDSMKAGFEAITADNVMALLTFISSDLLDGRDTASRGYKIAAEYAASLFKFWGIKPAGDMPSRGRFRGMTRGAGGATQPKRTYLQEIVFRETSDVSGTMKLETRIGAQTKSRTFQSGVDFSMRSSTAESLTAPVVFAGYGITEKVAKWDDFKKLDVKGKIVLILSEAPGKDNPKSPFQKNKKLKEKYFRTAPVMRRARGSRGPSKIQDISKRGPALIIQVQNTGKDDTIFKQLAATRRISDERPIITRARRRLSLPGRTSPMGGGSTPVITITREIANAILESSGKTIDDLKNTIEKNLKPASMNLRGTQLTITSTAKVKLVKCYNVLGLIEGSDPDLKNEVIVIGAHYDHLGRSGDYIFNGADDNGSGSVGVLAAARAFAANPVKPKRSILFALWTGEEKGLLGSRYYVTNPYIPIDKTVMYFNMDMISRAYDEQSLTRMGRMFQFPGAKDLMKKIRLSDFMTVNFTKGLDGIVREANQYVGLHLFLREAVEGRRGGGSDHASFASVKVPYVYTMAAMTSDYHQTSDSAEKVSKELFAKACRLTFLVSFAAANK
jgi:hypothetical protein